MTVNNYMLVSPKAIKSTTNCCYLRTLCLYFPLIIGLHIGLILLFVFITIPAGIYAENHYHTALANVDWLHGGAEFFLTLSNIFVVLGFRGAVKSINTKLSG